MSLRKKRQPLLLGIDFMLAFREFSDTARVWLMRTRDYSASVGSLEQPSDLGLTGPRLTIAKRWRKFFSDPSQWWDNRPGKEISGFPDFTHKRTSEGLWLDNRLNPPGVPGMVAALTPGAVQHNSFRWNIELERCVKDGRFRQAMDLFEQMEQIEQSPDTYTYNVILRACAGLRDLRMGRRIHLQVQEAGLDSDAYVGSSLVAMYAKCGEMADARAAFARITNPDLPAWGALIMGYVRHGEARRALDLSHKMMRLGVEPNSLIFVGMLNACSATGSLKEGRRIHQQVAQQGCESDVFVANSLMNMYFKCGSVKEAEVVFQTTSSARSMVCWSTMILGYVRCNEPEQALRLSQIMLDAGIAPDASTYVGMVKACTSLGALDEGRRIHEQLIQSGHQTDAYVGTSLISFYAKCGSVEDAQAAFDQILNRNVVSWNALITGYVSYGQGEKALEAYHQMRQEGVEPDPKSFSGILNACASMAALESGRRVHQEILEKGYESDVYLVSSLIDMYSKCGGIEEAHSVFRDSVSKNLVIWNTMLAAYAMHGHGEDALLHFEKMLQVVKQVDGASFSSLLSACSHAGLVDEGLHCFECMDSVYGISPSRKHYAKIVDILSRAGRLHEAEELVGNTMAGEPGVGAWMALLGGCRIHGNLEMGERAALQVLHSDPECSAGYVLLSNLYAAAGKWDQSESIQQFRLQLGIRKQPGCTWIEVDNRAHCFTVDDKEHPDIEEIHKKWEKLSASLREAGYVADTRFALHDVDDEFKKVHLGHHSEKLAIVYGLIRTPPRSTLRIFKNLRVCGDCHTATKLISKLCQRTIIVRDNIRFHHFENGSCSCNDRW